MPSNTPAPTAREIMRREIVTVPAQMTDVEAARLLQDKGVSKEDADIYTLTVTFMQHGFRHLPVTTGHLLKGMVSRRDVLKAPIEHYNRWTQKDEDERETPDIKAVFTPRYIIG